ncbi:hypothetical protein [Pontibacter litorisediminis]|uniref:hypothetical protein n=1 Tax=Pontibacter litorisediminis TaxID=1846260 RepID=UPI0023EB8A59|nr:hypothetical protein [Pontibacter litorisediminis]
MKTYNPTSPNQAYPYPEKELHHFCSLYPQEEAQQELWRWFIRSLKQGYDGLSSTRTTNLITFYENLKKLISAVYQLHDLSRNEAQEEIAEDSYPAAAAEMPSEAGPVARALETLHHNMPQSWTLLICPPE